MKLRTRIVAAALAGVMALSLAGCKGDEDVAAKVNGTVITNSEITKQIEQIKAQFPDMLSGADAEAREADLRSTILENLINNELVRQGAKDLGVEVTSSDVDKELADLKAGFPDEAAFQEALDQAGLTEDELKTQIEEQVLLKKVSEKLAADYKVSDDEIKGYFDKNKAQFKEEAAQRLAHILFAESDKAKAESVLTEIEDGADFAALAKANSIDKASAEQGGDLGWPTTPYVPEFQAAADKLTKVGDISPLVKSTFGYHIIKLLETREARQPELSEVTDKIKGILEQQYIAEAYKQFVDELREKAEIEYVGVPAPEAAAPDGAAGTVPEGEATGEEGAAE